MNMAPALPAGAKFSFHAAALRDAFDHGFTVPLQHGSQDRDDFLTIRLDDVPYLLRLADITALSTDHKISALPGQMAPLLGLAGFRGTLLPVYGLATLLGQEAKQPMRWLARTSSVAFAFTRLDAHLRLSGAQILPQPDAAPARRHISGFLQLDDHLRPVLNMVSLLETVRELAGAPLQEENPQ
jgi:chemotaxis signal transduction protein